MKKRLLQSFSGAVLLLMVGSCGQNDDKVVAEGVIEYTASVVDQSNPMASLAPSKMTIKFKNNKSCAEMSAGMGLFSTAFISNPETKTLTQLVKLLNKKFSLVLDHTSIQKENDAYKFELTPTKETKKIAGYQCEKVHVKMMDEFGTEFDIFYTKDLAIENPNFANPFYMIDGVLMEYQMKKFGLEMKFTAKAVKKEDVDDSAFELPADFKAISAEEMATLFESLQ
jgi:peptide-N-glycosidase F-like protein